MSKERDLAHVVSAYADELVTRRREHVLGGVPEAEPGLAEILDLTRTVSSIRIGMPPGVSKDLWHRLTSEALQEQAPTGTRRGPFGRFVTWLSIAMTGPTHRALSLRAIASALATLTLGWWFFSELGSPRVSAAELLQASSKAEAARLAMPGLVAHRAFTLEARRLPEAKLIATRRVELWANPRSHIQARRVFDEGNRLLAGEWTNADGSRVVYEPGKQPRRERAGDPKPLTADAIWRWEPSATNFSSLVVNLDRVNARRTEEGFQLSFDERTGRLSQAELTLDKDHLPLVQRIVLREGTGETVEFRTARRSAQEIPEARVAQASFEPEPELLPPPVPAPLPPATLRPLLSAIALDDLELQASYRLHRLAGCLAQPGELLHDSGGFRINVVLASEACRGEAKEGLATLATRPGVTVDVSIVGAKTGAVPPAGERPIRVGQLGMEVLSDEALTTIPAYHAFYELCARQALRAPGATDVDSAVRPMIRRLVESSRHRSGRALGYAREMERLSSRWSAQTLKKLGLDAASMWQAMVRDHARSLAEDSKALLAELQPALGAEESRAGAAEAPEEEVQLRNLSDLRRAIGKLNALVESTDVGIRQLLSPPPVGASAASADTSKLIRSLRRTAHLAERFAGPRSLEP